MRWLRTALLAVSLTILTAPLTVEAQQAAKIWRIGTLDYGSESARMHLWQAFRQGLRELGYVEGQTIVLETRWANGSSDALPRLAAELVALKPDLIAVASTPAALAMKRATATIPVVFMSVGDVTTVGLAGSLARPGGNVTGVATLTTEVSSKWLELLKDALPVARVGILWDAGNAAAAVYKDEVQKAAHSQRIESRTHGVRGIEELERALGNLKSDRVNALVVVPSPMFFSARTTIANLAATHRLPTVAGQREYAEAGMLMSYGANLAEGFRRAATYVDKVLRGAKPADLAIEQPTTFELVINIKTAKALGLTILPSLLVRADAVIQ